MADSAPVLTTAAARAKATDAGEVLSLTQIRQCEKHRAAAELAGDPTGDFAGVADLKRGLKDAQRCVALRPTWPKAHLRLGTALELLARLNQARDAYKHGANTCYPLNGGPAAAGSTVGQPMETHVRSDPMFGKLNDSFRRTAAGPPFRG